jgi:arsenite oxidase small subunit
MPKVAYSVATLGQSLRCVLREPQRNLWERGTLVRAIDEEQAGGGLSRRSFLATGAAGTVAAVTAASPAAAKSRAYPQLRVIALNKLKVNRAHTFDYPLKGQSSVVIDMGREVPGGVGPKHSIVAYSALCQHMGCPVSYRSKHRELFCPCHQSRYDPERQGSIIQGVATRPLPRILLQVRDGAVFAVGVSGLIYGRRSNLVPGKKVGGAS